MKQLSPHFANLSKATYWKNREGVYQGANTAFLALLGQNSADFLLAKRDSELAWQAFSSEINQNDDAVYANKTPSVFKETLINRLGETLKIQVIKIPLFNEKNEISGILNIVDSVLDAKRTQQLISSTKILNDLPIGIAWKDLNGEYIDANDAAKKFINSITANTQNITGCDDSLFYPKEIAERIIKHDREAIKENHGLDYEEDITLADGKKHTYLFRSDALHDEAKGIIGTINSFVDISKKNEQLETITAAKAVLQAEYSKTSAYLKSVVSNLPDHIFWEDLDGNFLGCNNQQAKSFGYSSAKEVIGKNVVEIGRNLGWDSEMIESLRKNDRHVMETGEVITAEEPLIFAGGRQCVMYSRKAPLKDEDGKIIGMLGLAFDITERKEMENNLRIAKEKAEEANIAKSDFIANISHDLRTPLHAMLGAAELIQVNPNDEHRDEMVNTILNAGKNLLKLIENVLSYSEFESSHKVSFSDSFDLRDLIESIVAEHTHAAETKKIALIVSYSDFVPHYVISHLQNVRRIVGNLLENAIKFTENGHVLIAVECLSIEEDSAELQIIVEDTGIGINKHDIEHIFDRFYRASPAHVNKYKGSGLGLAIIKQLTESMNGNIKVNSQLGYGTTFCCTIPFKLTEKLAHADDLQNQLDRARVLVIDDHKQRRQTLLKQFPSQNITAVNSRSAIATFNASEKIGECFNLIIIDEELETGTPEQLALALRDHSSLPLKPLLVLCRKINGSTATDEQRKLFKVILKKPLAPSEIASHIAPEWQTWYSAYQRKSHKAPDKKVHVLLVEDDPLIQKFTTNLLRDSGCEVELAATGRNAIEKAHNDFDLILMDIGLPDIDGLTVTEEIRSLVKDRSKQPVIVALTAHVSSKDREHCLKSGLDDFLKKPASYHDFQELLRKYF